MPDEPTVARDSELDSVPPYAATTTAPQAWDRTLSHPAHPAAAPQGDDVLLPVRQFDKVWCTNSGSRADTWVVATASVDGGGGGGQWVTCRGPHLEVWNS